MHEYEHNSSHHHGMSPFAALMTGVGIGMIGTVVVLAMNENKFRTVVEETKNMGEKLKHRFAEGVDVAKNAAVDTAESVERGASKVKRQFQSGENA